MRGVEKEARARRTVEAAVRIVPGVAGFIAEEREREKEGREGDEGGRWRRLRIERHDLKPSPQEGEAKRREKIFPWSCYIDGYADGETPFDSDAKPKKSPESIERKERKGDGTRATVTNSLSLRLKQNRTRKNPLGGLPDQQLSGEGT